VTCILTYVYTWIPQPRQIQTCQHECSMAGCFPPWYLATELYATRDAQKFFSAITVRYKRYYNEDAVLDTDGATLRPAAGGHGAERLRCQHWPPAAGIRYML
jgi:hypothetical protein